MTHYSNTEAQACLPQHFYYKGLCSRQLSITALYLPLTMPQTPCPECHKTFARKETMQCHMNSIHLQLKHRCSICDREFSTKGSLTRHINDVHKERRTFKCPECPLTFARQETLDKHVRNAKANWKLHGLSLRCSACGVEYDAPNHHAAMTRDCHECKRDKTSAENKAPAGKKD